MTFNITEGERDRGMLEPAKLAAIATAVATRGFAVVTDLISISTCELLMASVLEDAQRVRALGHTTAHEENTGRGHLQLGLRRRAPFVRADLVANPLIENVVAAVLGKGAWFGFYNGNVNMPGSTHQPLHYDRPFSWRTKEKAEKDGQSWPPPTTTLSCSVALTALTLENGATEIYPGTHLETAVTQWPLGERVSNHPDLIEKWGPPARMIVPAGAVCFRDPRMWHRGVPNPSEQARPMIGLTYHAERCRHWRGRLTKDLPPADLRQLEQDPSLRVLDNGELGDGRLVFDADTRDVFADAPSLHGINRNVRFIDEPLTVNHFVDAHLIGGARIVSDDVVAPGV